MRSLCCLATLAVLALAGDGFVQEPQKSAPKPQVTKAMYLITGLH